MPKIFLSYRRRDSMATTGRIFDRLEAKYGRDSVFMDVDGIPYGADFRVHLVEQVAQCEIFLAVIGPLWVGLNSNGDRRIDDAGDFVRIEVESALRRGIPVIPILVGGCQMPVATQLPKSIAQLSYHQGAEVADGRDFHSHIDRLIRGIDKLVQEQLERRKQVKPVEGFSKMFTFGSAQYLANHCTQCAARPKTFHIHEIESRKVVRSMDLCEICAKDYLTANNEI